MVHCSVFVFFFRNKVSGEHNIHLSFNNQPLRHSPISLNVHRPSSRVNEDKAKKLVLRCNTTGDVKINDVVEFRVDAADVDVKKVLALCRSAEADIPVEVNLRSTDGVTDRMSLSDLSTFYLSDEELM